MAWIELSLDTTHEAVDWVCTLLAETVDIDDIHITQYVEQDVEHPQWAFTIYIYLPHNVTSRTRVEKIVNLLSPLHRTELTTQVQMSVVEKKLTDANNPLVNRIGKRFVVLAPDTPYQSEVAGEVILRRKLSPSVAVYIQPRLSLSDCLSGMFSPA
jgi:ribosomal protein L11 methyltransferase